MRRFLLLRLTSFIQWLQRLQVKLSRENQVDINTYTSLSPIETADNGNHYFDALLWAISNRRIKNIRNIALTGSFGSGKSSILKTFQRKYAKKDLHFLNLSLATFKEEKENGTSVDEREIRRLIELSILQQIFYREEDSKIPDSRFKKIKSFEKKHLWITAGWLLIFALALVNHFNTQLLQNILKDLILSQRIKDILHYGTYIVIIAGIFFLLLKSVRIVSSITINKLKIQNTEIGLGDSISKSILNDYLDEIVYFFEVTNYNVVIIEDLDRFKETEIFTKLREINFVLNSSEKTRHKEIVFIYAVRDDMFMDKDRTKFFDFIIPVIPVINPSTSGQILIDKKEKHDFNFSDDLIESISLFIDDMRLLHNITNEFYLYKQLLDSNLEHDKLLAMVVYKNIFPNDFTQLGNGKGILHKCLHSKQKTIKNEILKIDESINGLQEEIKILESIKLKDIQELRSLYVLQSLHGISNFSSFDIDGTTVSVKDCLAESNFDHLVKNEVRYNKVHTDVYGRSHNSKANLLNDFAEIEKILGSYEKRKSELEIKNANGAEQLRKKIQVLEESKGSVRNQRLVDLLQKGHDIEFKDVKENHQDLINALLRGGFIDENYLDYISIFHEGSITRKDHQFRICVKTRKVLPPDYALEKVENLVKKIDLTDYSTPYILNYDLVNHILHSKQQYLAARKAILRKLSDESNESVVFVDNLIDRSPNPSELIHLLCKSWPSIWNFIQTRSSFTHEKKSKYLRMILEDSDVETLKVIADKSDLRSFLSNDSLSFFNISNAEKLKSIILSLKLEFVSIEFNPVTTELIEFVYTNNAYQLNPEMIKTILISKNAFNQDLFEKSNYTAIRNSKLDLLIKRINENLNVFFSSGYFESESNVQEEEHYLLDLLNNPKVEIRHKEKLIKKTTTKISQVNQIKDEGVQNLLFTESKLLPTWENLLHDFKASDNAITKHAIAFINDRGNSEALSRLEIKTEGDGVEDRESFCDEIVKTDEIEDACYELITKSIEWLYTSIELDKLTEAKVKALIKNDVLEPKSINFDKLKESFTNLHISFIEKYKKQFIEELDTYVLDEDDVEMIVKSIKFTGIDKTKILNSIDDDLILENIETIKAIIKLSLSDNQILPDNSLVKGILLNNSLTVIDRINFFNTRQSHIELSTITEFLNALGAPYSEITANGKRPRIELDDTHQKFAETLKQREYISSFEVEKDGVRISTYRK